MPPKICKSCPTPKSFASEQAYVAHRLDKVRRFFPACSSCSSELLRQHGARTQTVSKQCHQCKPAKSFPSEQTLSAHQQDVHMARNQSKPKLECGWAGCSSQFNSTADREAHMARHRASPRPPAPSSSTSRTPSMTQVSKAYSCGHPGCGAKFTTHDGLKAHGAAVHPQPVRSSVLQTTLPRASNMPISRSMPTSYQHL